MTKKPMICPDCGVAMNHHAEKLVDPVGRETALVNPVLGGIVEEIYTCPVCGKAESRQLAGESVQSGRRDSRRYRAR